MNEQNILDEIHRLSEKDGYASLLQLKCHTCKELLKLVSMEDESYECPDGHARVRYYNNKFIAYSLIWDADSEAKERYKLTSSANHTTLQLSSNETYWKPSYKTILTIESHLSLQVKDQTIVFDNLVSRLKKIKAFS